MTDERTPPHDLVAEQSTLGGMMLSRPATFEVLEVLRGRDFYLPKHELIFNAILNLASHGEPNDTVAVTDELLKHNELNNAGGADYLHTLTSIVPTAANAGYYATIVAERATLRRVVDAGTKIAQLGYATEGGDPGVIVEQAFAQLDNVTTESPEELLSVGDSIDYMSDQLEHPPTFYPTRWRDINHYINGLMPGAVYVVAARPGSGKTIMGLQMAVDLCKHGRTIFFSLEMPRDQIMRRLTASEGSINLTTLTRHTLTSEDWTKVAQVRRDIRDLPLFIDDRSAVSIKQIEVTARHAQRKGKLAGLVIDYLQLIPSLDARKPRWEHIGEVTRSLKMLAKDLRVPVIVLCQLNRESEKNRRLPGLHDLRESGSIEQDADAVIMLQRRIDDDDLPGDEVDVVIPKSRHGQIGRLELRWEGKYARVIDMPLYGATPTIDYAARQAGEGR